MAKLYKVFYTFDLQKTHVNPLKEVVLIKPYPKFQNTIVKTPKEVGLFKRSEQQHYIESLKNAALSIIEWKI